VDSTWQLNVTAGRRLDNVHHQHAAPCRHRLAQLVGLATYPELTRHDKSGGRSDDGRNGQNPADNEEPAGRRQVYIARVILIFRHCFALIAAAPNKGIIKLTRGIFATFARDPV
jgi:hypothetical protein